MSDPPPPPLSLKNESLSSAYAAITKFLSNPVPAGTTAVYKAQLVDSTGAPVPGTSLNSLTLSLYNTMTGDIVNDVQDSNIFNTGRGTIDDQGDIVITLGPDDTAVTDTPPFTYSIRYRSMVITWTDDDLTGQHQVDFQIITLLGSNL